MPAAQHEEYLQGLARAVRRVAHPLTGNWADFDPLMRMIGDARYVLIGEASHGTYEALFHLVEVPNFLLPLRGLEEAVAGLREPRLERAIGVIYHPETERYSHYFYSQLPSQFDAGLHLDETRSLEPLERTSQWEAEEVPETFPSTL